MAEEHGGGSSVGEVVLFVVGLIVVLVVLWVAQGMPNAKQLLNGGIFVHPPEPVGNGQSYGPTIPPPPKD